MSTLHVNLFRDSPALLELQPQGDARIALDLPAETAEQLLALAGTPEASAALAALFLAGVTVGERARCTGAAAR
jgi:hypothetical protein